MKGLGKGTRTCLDFQAHVTSDTKVPMPKILQNIGGVGQDISTRLIPVTVYIGELQSFSPAGEL